jgi:class 3 adenylate cyclase
MVEAGLAVALPQFSDDYVEAEARRKAHRIGIWASDFQMPADYRAAHPEQFRAPPAPSVPRRQSFAARPVSSASELYFRSCAEARAAGRAPVYRGQPGYPNYQTRVCIGIDSGPAVAIDSGRRDEREPLFIGSPANHAAKLADGDDEGVNLSPRAAAALGQSPGLLVKSVPVSEALQQRYLTEDVLTGVRRQSGIARLEKAYAAVVGNLTALATSSSDDAVFRFHHKEPPLKAIVYADHPPSKAIRMELASLFADVDGFTAYIDNAIATGVIAQAVANLHVLRAEMGAVVRNDFDGRKVRYIGDCIHGLIAEGTRFETNATKTMKRAVEAAAGLRSSFDLCREMLPGIAGLAPSSAHMS